MHVHVLGICGKFMSGLAIIAKQKGYKVTGSDKNLLSPIKEMLEAHDIGITQGYESDSIDPNVDAVIIGNALSRGVPVIERILNDNIRYYSGPGWLFEHVLREKWCVVVSGTHGKTTTTSMLAHILESAGYNPGFLIGGNPNNFSASARYTDSNFFVIEGDEYDTAFFDKQSKFLHYHPRTLIINNLEFDHADIFASLDDIKKQFRHLLRLVPSHGLVVSPENDANVQSLFQEGPWTPGESFGIKKGQWHIESHRSDGTEFEIIHENKSLGTVTWDLLGHHNIENALAAIIAARHVGISPQTAMQALNEFKGVKRRLELRGQVGGVRIYDDFAHHPTAIATTLQGLRRHVGTDKIIAVLEFGSNTMRAGKHDNFSSAFIEADEVVLLRPQQSDWNLASELDHCTRPVKIYDSVGEIVSYLATEVKQGDHVVCMSNLTFDGIHEKLMKQLSGLE